MSTTKSNIKEVKGYDQIKYEQELFIKPIKDQFKKDFNRLRKSIGFSDYIELKLKENELHIIILTAKHPNGKTINPVLENMQTDKAAFEGWAICLKAWIPDIVKTVKLDWTTPDNKNLHYNRFLYRVIKFKQWYKDWFVYNPEKQQELDSFCGLMKKGATNNYSNKEAAEGTNKEGIVEYNLINHEENKRELVKTLQLDFVGHHLPVGVKTSNGKSLFTGRQSAIDIWGISHDKVLKVIELKYNKNKNNRLHNIKVGIISELLFYCNIMDDIRQGNIKKPTIPVEKGIEQEKALYEKGWESVEGVMLATDYHPLLYKKDKLLEVLSANSQGIKFSMYQYDWDMNNKELKEIKPFNSESCK